MTTPQPRPWRAHWAAQRDASWYDHPDVRTPKRWHIDNGHGFAKCGGRPLHEGSGCRLASVPGGVRCQRRGCREHWPSA